MKAVSRICPSWQNFAKPSGRLFWHRHELLFGALTLECLQEMLRVLVIVLSRNQTRCSERKACWTQHPCRPDVEFLSLPWRPPPMAPLWHPIMTSGNEIPRQIGQKWHLPRTLLMVSSFVVQQDSVSLSKEPKENQVRWGDVISGYVTSGLLRLSETWTSHKCVAESICLEKMWIKKNYKFYGKSWVRKLSSEKRFFQEERTKCFYCIIFTRGIT